MNNKYLFILVVDDFSGLLWQVFIFSSKHSKPAKIMNGTLIDFSLWLCSNILSYSLDISIKNSQDFYVHLYPSKYLSWWRRNEDV